MASMQRSRESQSMYNSASGVVREASRLMETEDQLRAVRLEQLRQDIREGLESGPAKPWNMTELKREGRKRLSGRATAARK